MGKRGGLCYVKHTGRNQAFFFIWRPATQGLFGCGPRESKQGHIAGRMTVAGSGTAPIKPERAKSWLAT